ncbi:MAG: hypothetical protein Q8R82_20565 [Hyphomonadaceae bacterium]|nr:hypothetical protein [Hyphomonadaceae bacterium]
MVVNASILMKRHEIRALGVVLRRAVLAGLVVAAVAMLLVLIT